MENKKINLEFVKKNSADNSVQGNMSTCSTNPIVYNSKIQDNLSVMVSTILDQELPMLKNNSLLHDLVLYTLTEKVKTVQTVENVLSYIREKNVKEINDVRFKDGEVCIECSI